MELKSPRPALATSCALPVAAAALALGIFIIDTTTPLDIAIAVLYVVVVLLAAIFLQRRGLLLVAAACIGLTGVSYVVSHGLGGGEPLLRALVSLSAITITTLLALQNQSASKVLHEQASLLDLTHDTVFVRDMHDVITYWNHGAEELYGWQREQVIGEVSHRLLKTVFPDRLEAIMAELLRAGRWEGELVHAKRDGTPVIVASRWSLQRDERGGAVAILETNTDITARRRVDAELRESERRYRNIFQMAGVSIWEEDFSRVKAMVDDLRAGVRDFRHYLADHPDFVRDAIGMVRVIDVNDAAVKLFGARTKDELLVSLHNVFLPETEEAFAAALAAIADGRTTFETETVMRTLQGSRVAVLVTIAFPAALENVLVSIMDITERNRTQEALHQARSELAHVTRVTTLGQLTASIAHEVNQPLAAIVTNGEASLRWLGRGEPGLDEARSAVQRMIGDATRASQVVWRLRALARKADPQSVPLNVNDVIDDVVLLVQREVLQHRVLLRLDLSPALPPVLGDRVQLQQVIMNLVINAIQAMASVTDRPRDLVIRSRQHTAGQVLVAVEDSGVGIDPQNADRLFSAFFTTKHDGMGMGLSICRSIVEAHGGRIWPVGKAEPGAIFQFTLPSSENAPQFAP